MGRLDARTLERGLVLRVESQVTHQVVFSADGTRIITSAFLQSDGSSIVHVYDARRPREPEASAPAGRR